MKTCSHNIFYFFLLIFLLLTLSAKSQVYSNREVGEKHRQRIDSLKEDQWPYLLPIWGKKVTELGYDIPYSAGLSVNYLWQESDIIINNLQVGFSGSEKILLDDIVVFNDAVAATNVVNFRPDIWLFPFLNVYGIIASSNTSTSIDVSVVVPDSTTNTELLNINTVAEFKGTSMGFGLTPTIGVGGGFLALDMNVAWTDLEALSKPAFSFVFGPRLGKSFNFKTPERSIAVWAGGFRVHLKSDTEGSIPFKELFPGDDIDEKLDGARANLIVRQDNLDFWWNSLTPPQQQAFQSTYDRANELIDKAFGLVNGMDNAVNNGTIDYTLDKKQKNLWNFIIGTQYQHNKKWMIRGEFGFLASRVQFIGGVQYRFGL